MRTLCVGKAVSGSLPFISAGVGKGYNYHKWTVLWSICRRALQTRRPLRMPVSLRTWPYSSPRRLVSESREMNSVRGIKSRLTWNTVSRLCQKLSKFDLDLSSFALKLNFPPNTCIPSRANMTMNKKSNSNREAIDCMEFRRDATKFDNDRQYLERDKHHAHIKVD